MQLVDHSAFEQPNEIRDVIQEWVQDEKLSGQSISWADDSPYPRSITIYDEGVVPDYDGLMTGIQQQLGETEYLVFCRLADTGIFQEPMSLHVVTKTLIATMIGPAMVRALVRQLHGAAAPAIGVVSEE